MKVASQRIANSESRVVVGLGVTGLSCARHLYARDIAFSVVDSRSQPPGLQELLQEMPGVMVYAGEYPSSLLADVSELIVSPGVALDEPIVLQAVEAGIDVVGDIDLFVREASAPVVGITGSNAKSTVTQLLGQMAEDAGVNVGVGGNLGPPALELLEESRELYVLELSSFQLERAAKLNLAVATILNVSADHLDRHGDMSAYQQAKHRIFLGCKSAVFNGDNRLTIPLLPADVRQVSWRLGEPEQGGFGLVQRGEEEHLCRGAELLMPVSKLSLPGRHNIANALAALALGSSVGLPVTAMTATLSQFKGLPHRCELIAQRGGVSFVNDSKGTNVGATEAALAGLGGDRNILLLAGGQSKGADFSVLQAVVKRHCKQVLLFGEDAALIEEALSGSSAALVRVSSIEEAVAVAASAAKPGDCVLLSPACASFDMFAGFEQRGDAFGAAVAALPEVAQ
jgi:UDP-N-acetylmuramoylalanine--D-glutamate ligase